MSQQYVDVVKAGYDAFARGDLQTLFTLMEDDIQFRLAENSIYYRGEPYVGKQQLTELFTRIAGEWDGFSIQPAEFHDAGDVVVMEGRYGGRYKASGREANLQVAHVYRFRNGRMASMQQYTDTAGGREVAGLNTAAAASSQA